MVDNLNFPTQENQKIQNKLKRLIPSPNSYFMDVKCPGCLNLTTLFSHSQTLIKCENCLTLLCEPTGGKVRLNQACLYYQKNN
jgi:small subunit ribosomal protein S27e